MGVYMKSFWQHVNGKVYAVRSDTFGRITGADGPLDPHHLRELDAYEYGPGITDWVARAIAKHTLRRVNPRSKGRTLPLQPN
jgi:hypothetical protein